MTLTGVKNIQMIVWARSYSVQKQRQLLQYVLAVLACVVLIAAIFFPMSRASAAPSTISFSARLKQSNGTVVPDGYYNINFKLYNQAANGTEIWSETYYDENGSTEGSDYRVRVLNGYMSVNLGARTAFSTNVNWDSNLWLTMNIGGTAQVANTESIEWDGEMSPRIQLGAVPYAMNAGSIGGKNVNQLLQLGQGMQTDASSGVSSIFINKTGAGNLIELQTAGINTFTLDRVGSITLGSTANQSLTVAASAVAGRNLTIAAGGSTTTSGGSLILEGGDASGDGNGGDVAIDAGAGSGEGQGGRIAIGEVNATDISIGNVNSTTSIAGGLQSDNLDTTGESSVLSIGQTNASEIQLGQDTTIADGKTLTVGGDTTVSTNSTSALQVQDGDGSSKLTIDTTNSRIKIGSNDTITSLLVLDNRADESDPSGTDGAMYYNSVAGKFRCYEDSAWKDCVTPLPISKVAAQDTINDTATPVDIDDLSFDLAAHTKYSYKFVIVHTAELDTTGIGFGVTTPTDPTANNWCVSTTATLDSSTPGHWGSYCGVGDAGATTSGIEQQGTNFTSTMEGYIETGETGGTFKLRMKPETDEQVTVKAGSFGIVQIVQ